jgi:hypothetical protein
MSRSILPQTVQRQPVLPLGNGSTVYHRWALHSIHPCLGRSWGSMLSITLLFPEAHQAVSGRMYRMPALREARAFPPGHPDGLRLSQVWGRQDSPCQAPEQQEALLRTTLRPMGCQGHGCLQHQRGTWGTAACSANRWLSDRHGKGYRRGFPGSRRVFGKRCRIARRSTTLAR